MIIRSLVLSVAVLAFGSQGVASTSAADDEDVTVVSGHVEVAADEVGPNIFLDPFETLQCRTGNTDFTVQGYFDYH